MASSPSSASRHPGKIVQDLLPKNSWKRVYGALLEVRTKLLKQSDGLARLLRHGFTQALLKVLSEDLIKEKEKIINIALSVLGNCSLSDTFRQQVVLLTVLKLVPDCANTKCVLVHYSSPSIVQPSILRPPWIIRPLDLIPKGNFLC